MNTTMHAASIRYSGQWLVAAEIAPTIQVRRATRFSGPVANRCASPLCSAVCMSPIRFSADTLVTQSLRMFANARCDIATRKSCHLFRMSESQHEGIGMLGVSRTGGVVQISCLEVIRELSN